MDLLAIFIGKWSKYLILMKRLLLPLLAALALPTAVDAYEAVCKNKLRFLGYEDYKETYWLKSAQVAYSSSKKLDEAVYENCDNAEYDPVPPWGYKLLCNNKVVYIFRHWPMGSEEYFVYDKFGNGWEGKELSLWKKTVFSPTCTQISDNRFSRESQTFMRIYLPKAKTWFFLEDHKIHYYTQDPTKIKFQRPDL